MKMEKNNIEIMGYFVNKIKDSVFLEIQLKEIPEDNNQIVAIGFGRPLLLWMLQELDKEKESEEEVEKVEATVVE